MSGPEHFLRWLRTLTPDQAKGMIALVIKFMPEYTIEWVREGRRLVMVENDKDIGAIFTLISRALEEKEASV